MSIDFWNLTIQRLHKVPAGWKWHHLDAHDVPKGFTKVSGSVPIGVVSKGPRKGMPKRDVKNKETFFVHDDELAETERLWSEETGKCSRCCGSGQVFDSWSRAEGKVTKSCGRCDGTGSKQ